MRHREIAVITAISLVLALIPTLHVKADKPKIYTVTVNCNAPQVITGAQMTLKSIGVFTVTAYTNSIADCGKTDGITKSGVKAVEGITIAADWTVLPEGTIVYIDSVGYRTVEDTGSKVKGNHVDIYFSSEKEANDFGKQKIEIYVKENV